MILTGTAGVLHVRWVALEPIASATVGIMIRDRLGQEIFGVNTRYRDEAIGPIEPGNSVDVSFAMPMNLGDGLYTLTAAVHEGETHTQTCYDWVDQALAFQVLPNPMERFTGLCRLEPRIAQSVQTTPGAELDFARSIRSQLSEA